MPESATTPRLPGQEPPRARRRRWVALAVLSTAAGLAGWLAQFEIVLVTSEDNGELAVSSYTLQEDDFDHPRLRQLRNRERLDDVIAPGRTQFEKIVLLRAWARRQWDPAGSFYYPPWDAVEILDLARKHDNRGFCAQYAVVFLQACQSLGIHARYVDLPGHFVVAVWSDDYSRWVLMDPSNDIHFERNGVPMRGRDLHHAYWSGDLRGMTRVESGGRRRGLTRDDLSHYRLYSIGLSANQLAKPVEVKSNGRWTKLVRASDYRTYPRVGGDPLVISSDFLAWRGTKGEDSFSQRPETIDQDEFRYAINQTVIFLANQRLTDRVLKVGLLNSNSPTFARFLIRSEEGADWLPTPSAAIKWRLHPGTNRLSARIETRHGWRGNISSMRVFYKPPLFESLPSFRGGLLKLVWHRSI